MVKRQLDERCQKGYKTDEKRKTKKMYGKTYRNCVKAETVIEKEACRHPMDEILRAEDIIRKHLEEMFDEIGRDDLTPKTSQQRYLWNQLSQNILIADVRI